MHDHQDLLGHDVEDRRLDIRDEFSRARLDTLADDELELALKAVCWTPRDVHHFLRSRAAH